jgi:hypothetical protein
MVESLKIILVCVAAAVLYGIVLDQFTARICLQYFTVFHPPVFTTQSPTLLAFGWGLIATWWMGAFVGILLTLAARAGSRPKLRVTALLQPIAKLLATMAGSAFLAGLIGFVLTKGGAVSPPTRVLYSLSPSLHARFMADWYAHNTSYAVAFFGGIALCALQYERRKPPVE